MPTIRQLPSGLWNVQVRAKGHKARSASFPTKSEAQAWSEQQLRKIKDQLPARTLFNLGEQFVSIGLLGNSTGNGHETMATTTAPKTLGHIPNSKDAE